MESQKEMQYHDIWRLLNSKIKDGFSSIKHAFLTFDDVNFNLLHIFKFVKCLTDGNHQTNSTLGQRWESFS